MGVLTDVNRFMNAIVVSLLCGTVVTMGGLPSGAEVLSVVVYICSLLSGFCNAFT